MRLSPTGCVSVHLVPSWWRCLGGLGAASFLEKTLLGVHFENKSPKPLPVCLLCFALAVEDVSSQLPIPWLSLAATLCCHHVPSRTRTPNNYNSAHGILSQQQRETNILWKKAWHEQHKRGKTYFVYGFRSFSPSWWSKYDYSLSHQDKKHSRAVMSRT